MRAILEEETIYTEELPKRNDILNVIYKGVSIGEASIINLNMDGDQITMEVSFDFIGPSITVKWQKSFVARDREN
jgi:septum formation topological specificity factor MinE